MSRRASIFAAILLLAVCASAQEQSGAPAASEPPREVSAPFVSRLKAEVEGTSIVLSWQDSTDARGPLSVYRSTEEITASSFARATKIAQVAYGIGSYVDHPADTRPYFYAVLASDSAGRPYEVFVSFRNRTLMPRAIGEVGRPEMVGARITAISAVASSTGIRVTFTPDRGGRTLVLYRATSPVKGFDDLLSAVAVILDPGVTSYNDSPPPGIPFYYAVADEELAKLAAARFVAGENATRVAATVPLQKGSAPGFAAGPPIRPRPLPFLVPDRGVLTGASLEPAETVPPRRELSAAAEESVSAYLAATHLAQPPPMKPVVLDVDRAASGGGEEALLQSIIDGTLKTADRETGEKRLRDFLGVRREPRVEARARFYLGQALYFDGRKSEALVELLLALDLYYPQVWPWVDRCLDDLAGIR